MQKYNNHLIRNPPTISNKYHYCEPQKHKGLLEEEIYTTIISILKNNNKKFLNYEKN